jgi:hypothetical protein
MQSATKIRGLFKLAVCAIAVISAISASASNYPNTVTFTNLSGNGAFVKLIGPVRMNVSVPNIAARSRDYEQIESEIRTTSPAYAALTQPVPPRTTEIQAELGDDETVFLEYALGVERSYGWLVSRTSVKAFELPPKKNIEALARRYYELLSDRATALRRDDSEVRKIALELGKTLLGPIAPSIRGKRLVVIPTGALCYVSFEALGDPDSQREFTPLITRHVISNLPSASVLPLLRAQTADHNSQRKLVAIIADPVFERSDARVRPTTGQTRPAETRDVEVPDDRTRGKQLMSLGRLGARPRNVVHRVLFVVSVVGRKHEMGLL